MKTFKNNSVKSISIENELESVYNFLQANSSENTVVVREKVPKRLSCKGIISVYRTTDLAGQRKEDTNSGVAHSEGSPSGVPKKPLRVRPRVRYVFYDDIYRHKRLGSIAIYGENIFLIYLSIKKSHSIFGHRVVEVSIKRGLQLFVDVRIAS